MDELPSQPQISPECQVAFIMSGVKNMASRNNNCQPAVAVGEGISAEVVRELIHRGLRVYRRGDWLSPMDAVIFDSAVNHE